MDLFSSISYFSHSSSMPSISPSLNLLFLDSPSFCLSVLVIFSMLSSIFSVSSMIYLFCSFRTM